MKTKTLAIGLIILLLLSVGTMIYYAFFKVLKIESSNYEFTVQDHIGLNGDTDAVKFGGIKPNGAGIREISFRNTYDHDITLRMKAEGEYAEWISYEDNNFVLEPNEARTIKVRMNVPENASYGNYSGVIKAYYVK